MSTPGNNRIRGLKAVLLGLLMAAGLIALVTGLRGRSGRMMADHWRSRLDQASDDQVLPLLAGVAELGEPGIPVLVEAFGSQRESVARAGKQILIEELSRWELLSSPDASRRLAVLADSLAERIDRFGPTARTEAAELATRILLWPLDDNAVDCGRVTQSCDTVIRVSAPELRLLDQRNRSGGATRLLVGGDPTKSDGPNPQDSMMAAVAPDHPKALPDAAPIVSATAEKLPSQEPPTVVRLPKVHPDDATRLQVADGPPDASRKQIGIEVSPLQRIAQLFSVGQETGAETDDSSPTAEGESPWPVAPLPPGDLSSQPAESNPIADSLLRANTITVMRQLRSADEYVASAAGGELSRRGFSPAHLELARRLFDPDPSVRKQVGRAALSTPGINPVPWLLELSRDDDPEVRLTAVTLMATTGEPSFLSNIEEIARRDPNERVRRQAQRISQQRPEAMR